MKVFANAARKTTSTQNVSNFAIFGRVLIALAFLEGTRPILLVLPLN